MNEAARRVHPFPFLLPDSAKEPGPAMLGLLDETFSETAMRRLVGAGCEPVDRRHWDDALYEPLRDFLERTGKGFRARLVALCYGAAGGEAPCPHELPLLVEMLHAGSLIVDDIEDEAVERRGAPALHRIYGLQRALNAGNWLYFWPLCLAERLDLTAERHMAVQRMLSRTMLKCHHGQALDLSLHVGKLSQEEMPDAAACTTRLKTGALMGCAAALGALVAGKGESAVEHYHRFGVEFGMGLQMLDDLGSMVSEGRREKAREDLVQGRPVWPWAWAAQSLPANAYSQLRDLAARVHSGSEPFEHLRQALAPIASESGMQQTRDFLGAAFDRFQPHVNDPQVINKLRREVARLEKSYA